MYLSVVFKIIWGCRSIEILIRSSSGRCLACSSFWRAYIQIRTKVILMLRYYLLCIIELKIVAYQIFMKSSKAPVLPVLPLRTSAPKSLASRKFPLFSRNMMKRFLHEHASVQLTLFSVNCWYSKCSFSEQRFDEEIMLRTLTVTDFLI